MATWSVVSRVAGALEGVEESLTKQGLRQWRVKDKLVAWERPLRRSDLEALGDDAPKGAILGVSVPDLETKDLLVTQRPSVFFTTPHFDGYASVLVKLAAISTPELRTVLTEAWTTRLRPAKKKKK